MLGPDIIRLMLKKRADGLPAEIREKARLHIADTLGIALAAARGSPVAGYVLDAMGYGAASGACPVIGHEQKLPPAFAAMANSALAHTMDYDDIHDVARVHPTAVTLPAALAAGGIVGARGDAIVDAVALGDELICRLGDMLKALGAGPGADWFLSQLFGYMGACLAAGVVLELSEQQQVAALGLAYMQMAGGKEPAFGIGANSRSIYTGFAAMGGVQAALLARAGMVGPASAMDGAAGMFPLYLGIRPTPAQIETLLQPDGWTWQDTKIKPWPCCRSSHPYVSVALDLHRRVVPGRIRRVVVAVTAAGARLCRPLEHRRRPQTLPDAKYSIPFVTAFALCHGRVDLLSLNEASLNDLDVLRVAGLVEAVESISDRPGPAPAEITVELDDGSQVSASLRDGLKLTPDEIRQKFLACLAYAGRAAEGEAVWDRLTRIEAMSTAEILASVGFRDPGAAAGHGPV